MGINAEAWRLGWAAHRDGLFVQYVRAVDAANRNPEDGYARAWLDGWYDHRPAA